jgi:hypothetical protein
MKSLTHVLLFSGALLALNSCLPEPGCMDLTAENYNPEAEENDGSCIDSRDKLIGNFTYTKLWTDVVTTGDSIAFGEMQITESGLAKNDFLLNLDGQVILRGAVSAFDLVMYTYTAYEYYQGFQFTRSYIGTGEWLLQDTVDFTLSLSTERVVISGTPPALTTIPQTEVYYVTKVQ